MTNLQKRLLLFLIGCIGTRTLFVVIAKNLQGDYLRYAGYLALLPAIGFMYIFLTGARQTGPETMGARIWWNDLRPVHAALYFLFAYNAIKGVSSAWIYLLADVLFGLLNFTVHHSMNGDFATALRGH
jgi:hypothetical protein